MQTPSVQTSIDLKRHIRDIPDFPTKGILFRDITPLLQDGAAFSEAIRAFVRQLSGRQIDAVVAIESRGLIIGSALAFELGVGIVPVRKAGKLPYKTYRAEYTLEYGKDVLEVHQDALSGGTRVVLVDDLLATGGTMEATIQLLNHCGGEIVALAFLVELTELKGRERLSSHPVISLISY